MAPITGIERSVGVYAYPHTSKSAYELFFRYRAPSGFTRCRQPDNQARNDFIPGNQFLDFRGGYYGNHIRRDIRPAALKVKRMRNVAITANNRYSPREMSKKTRIATTGAIILYYIILDYVILYYSILYYIALYYNIF